jgi:hypothetical protein
VPNSRYHNGIDDAPIPTCFQQYQTSYYDLKIGPATGSQTETIGMTYEHDARYGAVLPEARTHVSAPALGVEKTPCYYALRLGFLIAFQ